MEDLKAKLNHLTGIQITLPKVFYLYGNYSIHLNECFEHFWVIHAKKSEETVGLQAISTF